MFFWNIECECFIIAETVFSVNKAQLPKNSSLRLILQVSKGTSISSSYDVSQSLTTAVSCMIQMKASGKQVFSEFLGLLSTLGLQTYKQKIVFYK